MEIKQSYNGFDVYFDDKREVWFAHVKLEGEEYRSPDNRVENASLAKLKELLDKVRRAKFERMSCFVRTDHYRYGGGRDEKYLPYYTEATVTSISPNGNAYVVSKGEKHAQKIGLGYSSDSIILDTPQNRKLIATFEASAKKEWEAEREQVEIRKKLTRIDGKKVYKQVYGKDL